MKEHPILFRWEMVRAILAGRKTQTRRIAKLTQSGRIKKPGSNMNWHPDDPECFKACAIQAGDRLWVRETHSINESNLNGVKRTFVNYAAGKSSVMKIAGSPDRPAPFDGCDRWRPSIHMPRWASRINLEVTDVRFEPLQSITEKDAIQEGVERFSAQSWRDYLATVFDRASARDSYRTLWDSLAKKTGCRWVDNPVVVVICFTQIDQ